MNRTVVCDNFDQIKINLVGQSYAIGAPAKLVVELLNNLQSTSSQAEEIEKLKAALKSCREAARNNFSVTTRDFASMCGVSATQLSEWTSDPITTEPDFKD
jgi:DNA-binding transcriptional regulator YiaG